MTTDKVLEAMRGTGAPYSRPLLTTRKNRRCVTRSLPRPVLVRQQLLRALRLRPDIMVSIGAAFVDGQP
jgi:hypothetical protein